MKLEKEGEKVVLEDGGRQKKSRFIVNMVNPRFHNYSRPLLLAITVGLLTFILMVCTCLMMMAIKPKQTYVNPIEMVPEVRTTTGTCTTDVTYPQQTGPQQLIRAFMRNAAIPQQPITDKNVKITVTADLCLIVEVKLLLHRDELSMSFMATQGVNALAGCIVPDEFIFGQGLIKKADVDYQKADQHCKQGESWCWTPPEDVESIYVSSYCEGLAERYTVFSPLSLSWITGLAAIKDSEAYHANFLTCPPLDNAYGAELPWLVTFRRTVTTCVNTTTVVPEIAGVDGYFIEGKKPTFSEALGTAFAYASYFEIGVTLLVVQSLLRCGFLKTAIRVVPDWA